MRNKIIRAFLAAAGATVCGVVGYAAGKGRRESGINRKTNGRSVSDAGDVSSKSTLTEDKVRRCLLNLFWMYDYDEFWHFRDCGCDDSDLRDCAAGHYAPVLYRYMKKNMKTVYKIDGDDGTGCEPFDMTGHLFYVPACRICSGPEEMVSDRFHLSLDREVWLLEDGRAASVYCMEFEKDGWRLVYRFLDKYIRMPGDIAVSFEELEEGLVHMMEESGKDL